tara:strand:- start:5165 stop:5548 length:384 start_codon:yes stop_codon:yes gene_type:complete
MANELTVSVSASYEKANHTLSFTPETDQIDVSGDLYSAGVQNVPSSGEGEALSLNDMNASDQGWAWFQNIGTDASTHVSIGPRSGGSFVECFQLKGGEFAIMRIGDNALYARASSGTLDIFYSIIQA